MNEKNITGFPTILVHGEASSVMNDWLVRKSFIMHSGIAADFKIEEEALTNEEIETFAWIIQKRFKFSGVTGVPEGGLRIAAVLEKYCIHSTHALPWLIVDDVLTTGQSMEEYRGNSTDIGVVLFARGPCPDWIMPVFRLWDMTK